LCYIPIIPREAEFDYFTILLVSSLPLAVTWDRMKNNELPLFTLKQTNKKRPSPTIRKAHHLCSVGYDPSSDFAHSLFMAS